MMERSGSTRERMNGGMDDTIKRGRRKRYKRSRSKRESTNDGSGRSGKQRFVKKGNK